MTGIRTFLCLLLFLFSTTLLQAQQDEEIDWIYEINLLGKELAEKHKNLFFKTDSGVYFSNLRKIANETPGQSLFQVSVRLQQVIALMGDAHTRINYHFNIEKDYILPIDFYWFEDGIYVLRTRRDFQDILGKKLISINGTPLDQVIDSLSTLIVNDNLSMIKNTIPRMITWTQLLEHFGFGNHQEIKLDFKDTAGEISGQEIRLPMDDSEILSVQPDSLPLGWRDRKSYFLDQYFPGKSLYYIQYNRCWSREVEEKYGTGASALFMPSFKEFEKQTFQILKHQKVDKLVFDMRFNGGGNSNQGTRFIKQIAKTKVADTGQIFVIVGRKTFSSAIINTVDFMKYTDAVIVGEETSGRPNHYGEINRFVLPESKLVVNYSTKYFTQVEKDIPSIIPDVMTPFSMEQFMHGIDPALEAILHYNP